MRCWLRSKQLWFAFILWFTDIDHNSGVILFSCYWVVICFHSLIYWYWPQQFVKFLIHFNSCDLLSFFDLLILTTTTPLLVPPIVALWFAFILWFTDIDHNNLLFAIIILLVVICFHSLIYWYWPQLHDWENPTIEGCDLLSFFDLLILTTTIIFEVRWFEWLWFAFILWFTDIDHNSSYDYLA